MRVRLISLLLLPCLAALAQVNPGDADLPLDLSKPVPGLTSPQATHAPEPEYSKEARKRKLAGTVRLSLVVDSTGATRDIRVVKPLGYGLDEKAIEAVQKWTFKPGVKDGHPVNVKALVEVTFRLVLPTNSTCPVADTSAGKRVKLKEGMTIQAVQAAAPDASTVKTAAPGSSDKLKLGDCVLIFANSRLSRIFLVGQGDTGETAR